MFPVTSRVTCVRATPGVYRLFYRGRSVRGTRLASDYKGPINGPEGRTPSDDSDQVASLFLKASNNCDGPCLFTGDARPTTGSLVRFLKRLTIIVLVSLLGGSPNVTFAGSGAIDMSDSILLKHAVTRPNVRLHVNPSTCAPNRPRQVRNVNGLLLGYSCVKPGAPHRANLQR
jgi:hypothetical protein